MKAPNSGVDTDAANCAAQVTPRHVGKMINEKDMTSGIKLIEDIEGTGREALRGDIIEFESQGYLSHGECIQERLNMTTILGKRSLIAGIEYSLVGMKAGGYRKVKISPHLGYRNEGVEGKIPPNAVLIFELWLHRVGKDENSRMDLDYDS